MKPIIIGAGLAGLSTALELSPLPVTLVSPSPLGEACSSALAQGGIAAAVAKDDKPELHARDTQQAGHGLNDAKIVGQVTAEGPRIIEKLEKLGVVFDRDTKGALNLRLEAAHGKRRIVHVKDGTGKAIMKSLVKAVRAAPSITIIENAEAQHLLTKDGAIAGAVFRKNGAPVSLHTNHVVLATGGCAALWRDTTVPLQNWGKGLALAARAGATLGDMEFMQFHPTAIDIGRDPLPLATESLRGEGALLLNEKGERFVNEMQPRDVVARAVFDQIRKGQNVFLDARAAGGKNFAKRFPTIYGLCLAGGIDPTRDLIPVRPAAHFHMGGILTNENGRTDIEGLWACGEVAATGLHGANRLASNSLLEAACFGFRAARDIKSLLGKKRTASNVAPPPPLPELTEEEKTSVRAVMSAKVGVIRDKQGLSEALSTLAPLARKSDMALVGFMIAMNALNRKESRGAHFRSDYPHTELKGRRSTFRLADAASGNYNDAIQINKN